MTRYAFLILIAGGLAVGWVTSAKRDASGAVNQGGTLDVSDLRAGDCFDWKGETSENDSIADVTAQPCSQPHHYEVFLVSDLPAGGFPSDTEFNEAIASRCVPAFNRYVGITFERSSLDIYPMVPVEAGWNDGDHSITCAAGAVDLSPLSSSVKGSRR